MNQEAKEYYERKNSENRAGIWIMTYLLIGTGINYCIFEGHIILSAFLSVIWPWILVKELFFS